MSMVLHIKYAAERDALSAEDVTVLCGDVTTAVIIGANCGWAVPRMRIANTSAEIQAALHKKG
eukprot:3680681-Amphidinium_carterae.1